MKPERLKSHALDFDSNVVFTKTPIFLLQKDGRGWKNVEVTQKEFDDMIVDGVNYKYIDNDMEASVAQFREKGDFMKQLLDALQNERFGPSRKPFLDATKNAYPTSIITARGQPMDELREGHRHIIYKILEPGDRKMLVEHMRDNLSLKTKNQDILIERYLENNLYLPVSSNEFLKEFSKSHAVHVKIRKNMGFQKFVEHVQDTFTQYYGDEFRDYKKFSVGFSDDSPHNIQQMENFIKEKLLDKFSQVKFVLYNTNDPTNIHKVILQGGDQSK
jgi:hypothetical protein